MILPGIQPILTGQHFQIARPFAIDGIHQFQSLFLRNMIHFFNPVLAEIPPPPSDPPALSLMLADPPENPMVLDNVVVSWPASATGYVLQTNLDLTTTNWGDYTGSVTNHGGINSVTLSKSTGSLFFRLRN